MKLCVIGTSHLGALKLGWDLVRDQFAAHELVFFGSPGSSLRQTRVRNGILVPIDQGLSKSFEYTSGGLNEINPDLYDGFIVYGLMQKLPRLRRGISKAVMQATMKDIAEKGLALKIATRLRSATDKRMWLGANPMVLALDGEVEPGTFYAYDALLNQLQRNFAVKDAEFLPQPAETMGSDLRTAVRFGGGSVRLLPRKDDSQVSHPDDDEKHMNGTYGRLWLLRNLPAIVQGVPS